MNLEALTSKQPGSTSATRVQPPKRRWLTRVALPALILLLAAGLIAYAARDTFLPARSVKTVSVVAKEVTSSNAKSVAAPPTVSVQAPGWVEPDPYPNYVTALTNGVIEEVLVLEGHSVKKNQVVARMVDDDAKLAVARAEADLARRNAMLRAAQTDWDNPIGLQRDVAVGKAQVAEAEAELFQLAAVVIQQRARESELQVKYDRITTVSRDAASQLEIDTAKYQLEAQKALVKATEQQKPMLQAKVKRYEAEQLAAEQDLRLRVELKKALEEAQASVDEAQAALDEANLRLTRMEVVSPVAGIVMNRLVAPGTKIMLDMDSPHSAHIVHVYDPQQLQVRVDVPLADAAKVGVGQKAWIFVDVLPDHQFEGRVTRLVHLADISKNTVEVKVAIDNPSPVLKPDMLAHIKFLATPKASGKGEMTRSGLAVFVPKSALRKEADSNYVWIITPDSKTTKRRTVEVGSANEDGWVPVLDGLQPGDVVIDDPPADLKESERVTVKTRDPSSKK